MSFDLHRLQNKIKAQFDSEALLEQAVTHRSVGKNNNERLEFLGDSILGFIIADELHTRFPEADEGVMSRLKAHLVNKEALAEIGKDLNLSDELVLGPGEMKSGGKHRASILSDAVEALIGAMYLDKGLDAARAWVFVVLKKRLSSLTLETASKDPKTQLQEYLQARGVKVPKYTIASITGLAHNQQFKVECDVFGVDEKVYSVASSRKKAEQMSAAKILNILQSHD
ncbi:MAG: ribonuclease III [Cycloclasticus sp. symbiont of Poecilosclerida sp. N]|nr:MAG: ribonuclease III [Cycloclasticus sp. symbiont of Poecilosclerida sp. N]